MQQRRLGANGPEVGALGLGCMSFAGPYGKIDEAHAHRLLAASLDLGITHLDTAVLYGGGISERASKDPPTISVISATTQLTLNY